MKIRALIIALGVSCLAGEAFAEEPVVLDVWNRYQTKVEAARATKQGWPWGWYPKMNLYVMKPGAERDDIVTVQHFKGRKKWGKAQKCRTRMVWDKKRGIAQFECNGEEKMATNRPGRYSVKVTYKAVGADKVYKNIATYSYTVNKFKLDNRHVKRRFKPSPGFVVDHDFRIGEAWMSEVEKDEYTPRHIRFRTWFKYAKEPRNPQLRCYLNGKKIAQADATRKQTSIEYRPYVKANKQAGATIWAKHYWHFYKLAAAPPAKSRSGISYPDTFYLSKNPGKYKCTATADGDKLATFHFEVGADGKVKRPGCQSETDRKLVNTLDSVHLIKVDYGKGVNLKYAKKAFKKSPLLGRTWPKGCPL